MVIYIAHTAFASCRNLRLSIFLEASRKNKQLCTYPDNILLYNLNHKRNYNLLPRDCRNLYNSRSDVTRIVFYVRLMYAYNQQSSPHPKIKTESWQAYRTYQWILLSWKHNIVILSWCGCRPSRLERGIRYTAYS